MIELTRFRKLQIKAMVNHSYRGTINDYTNENFFSNLISICFLSFFLMLVASLVFVAIVIGIMVLLSVNKETIELFLQFFFSYGFVPLLISAPLTAPFTFNLIDYVAGNATKSKPIEKENKEAADDSSENNTEEEDTKKDIPVTFSSALRSMLLSQTDKNLKTISKRIKQLEADKSKFSEVKVELEAGDEFRKDDKRVETGETICKTNIDFLDNELTTLNQELAELQQIEAAFMKEIETSFSQIEYWLDKRATWEKLAKIGQKLPHIIRSYEIDIENEIEALEERLKHL